MFKKISLALLVLVIAAGIIYFFQNKKDKTEPDAEIESKLQALYPAYNQQLLDEQKTIGFKQFDHATFSVSYPNNWQERNGNRTPLILDSPESAAIKAVNSTSARPYIISFKVTTAAEYENLLDKSQFTANEIQQRANYIQNSDFTNFSKLYMGTGNVLSLDHWETTVLNGKTVAVRLSGNEKIFNGVKIMSLAQGNLIEIEVNDHTFIPLPGLVGSSTNLLSLIKDRAYNSIVQSIKIK